MSQQVPVSIIVPTRNRAACLVSMLETLERYQREGGHRFQLIIADNSDDDSLRARVEASPLQIDYRYTSDVLSVVENFNRTVPLIQGEFACFVGDDDIITLRLFELVGLMAREKIDAAIVSPTLKCLYFWPGVTNARWGEVGGRLYLSRPSGRVEPVDLDKAVRASRHRICDGPLGLPRAYFGVVSKQCMDRVIARHGELFGGVSPDIFSSRLLAQAATKCVSVDLPFIAPGAGKSSTSAARSERSDVGKLRENDHTGRFKELAWSPLVPDFYSPFTVWAQSLLQAEKLMGMKPATWALPYLYAKCLLFSRGHMADVRRAIANQPSPRTTTFLTALSVVHVALRYLVEKLPLLIHQAPGGADDCFEHLASSDAAATRLDAHIGNIPLRYSDATN